VSAAFADRARGDAVHDCRRDRLLITSARGRLGRWARLIAPAVVDSVAARAIRERR